MIRKKLISMGLND